MKRISALIHLMTCVLDVDRACFPFGYTRSEQIERSASMGRGEVVKLEDIEPVRERFLNSRLAPSFAPVYNF